MEDLYTGLGIASIVFAFLVGVALVANGFSFITIHKHYHNDNGVE